MPGLESNPPARPRPLITGMQQRNGGIIQRIMPERDEAKEASRIFSRARGHPPQQALALALQVLLALALQVLLALILQALEGRVRV